MISIFATILTALLSVGCVSNSYVANSNQDGICFSDERSTNDYEHCHSTDFPNATFISNAFYFDKLRYNYGYNTGNTCGIIATQILLGYYDTFENDNIVDEEFDLESENTSSSYTLSNWIVSPGTGHTPTGNTDPIPDDQRFRDELIQVSNEVNHVDPEEYGMTSSQVRALINHYLNGKSLNHSISYHTSAFNYFSIAESAIDDGNPFIASIDEHFVVVYGYDSDYFYFDTGWGYTARADRDSFTEDSYRRCIIDLTISDHYHSNNYYNSSNNYLICGCGDANLKRLRMDPADWSFEERYYFDYKNVDHNNCGLSFSTKRLRTGYIQSSVINLSPRRYNAGFATLDITIPYSIRNFSIDMAWWSNHELQNGGYARIMYLDTENDDNWITDFVDIHNLGLNTSYQNLTKECFSMPEETYGLRVCATNSSTGDRNLGRLSLGRMDIDYYA